MATEKRTWRRVWRFFLCVALLGIASCGEKDPGALRLVPSKETLYANGTDSVVVAVEVVTEKGRRVPLDSAVTLSIFGPEMTLLGVNPLPLEKGRGEARLVSTFEAGEVTISAGMEGSGLRGETQISVVSDFRDQDSDGFPDVVELFGDTDRLNFRRWLCAVAESQVYEKNRRWSDVTTDCAGFIRFCYIEALKVHDDEFFSSYGALANPASPDVKRYNYPAVPLLGSRVFRTADGPFVPGDQEEGELASFSAAATAGVLLRHNVVSLGMEGGDILPGDLLFFFNPDNPRMPYHVMIYLGEWGRGEEDDGLSDGGDDWVVYHTGPRESDSGEVRKVRLETLRGHPDERWRPVSENDHFLGSFRFKILE
jgi:uncharacterized protein YfaT (DUF1175 family)